MIASNDEHQQEIAMEYVTRTGASFDRAAMIWLLRRFIDPEARITMLPTSEVMAYAAEHDALPFHHPKAELRHRGATTGFAPSASTSK
jgi:hypothetical protein